MLALWSYEHITNHNYVDFLHKRWSHIFKGSKNTMYHTYALSWPQKYQLYISSSFNFEKVSPTMYVAWL